ncbi:MAG: Rieske 2Fe-2S domain-containing protein [Gammaproteobacteria bacterium]
MSSESTNILLCPLHELPEACSRSFVVKANGETIDLFLVRKEQSVHAYKNSCPHTGGPLDWMPDQFLNIEGDLIQCATHDALFQIESGLCVSGPCTGDRLTAVRVIIEDEAVWLLTDG